jgi:hypothetical protein
LLDAFGDATASEARETFAGEPSGAAELQPMQKIAVKSANRSPIVTILSFALIGNVGD